MKDIISHANVSFNYLRNSTGFLNIILNNISSCIMLLDQNMELQAFNNSLTDVFSGKKDKELINLRCGEAINCSYTIDEKKRCGETSHCARCLLRESVLLSYYERKAILKRTLTRYFYLKDEIKKKKHLEFSTHFVEFERERYIIMIVDDVTELHNTKKELSKKTKRLRKLESQF